jgi:3-oxoadipate enol-lactonase
MPEVRAGDATIEWQAEGPAAAPVLLLSHSIGTTSRLWDSQTHALAGDFRVVRYDTRGHGGSTAAERPFTIDDLGRDALAVLDAAGVDRAHVCGISMGGMTAMWLGVHAPQRVRSLVFANTAAKLGTEAMWTDRIAQVRAKGMAPLAEYMMTRWFSDAFRKTSPAIVAQYQSMFAACDPAGYAGCAAALRDADMRPFIARITAPSLVVVGREDPATPPRDGEAIRDAIIGARLVALEASHLSNVECAEAFTSHVLAFLRGTAHG